MAANHSNSKGTFAYIEARIRRECRGTSFGGAFEWLCRYFLETAPKYAGLFDKIWRWNEWPDRWGIDKGIDLVARTAGGELWAIQAKADSPERSIPKREVDSFLSESNRPQFDFRLIIATTDDIGRNARETIAGQQIPVGLILRGDLLNAEIDWPTRIGEAPRPLTRKKPRPHQASAIRDVVRGFRHRDRGQLIMACGTGKTLTALWIAEKLQNRRTLVLVPSLSLISQTLSEWGRTSRHPFDALVVCSDETVADGSQDAAVISTSDLGVPVTTDVAAIMRFLRRHRRGRSAVVFCTYQSSDRIADAQQRSAPPFDLVIADEAHRCTGLADSLFTTVLDARKIKAHRRLFMTATPRYFTGRVKKRAAELEYELASMDDESRFGPVFHRLTFDAAIRDGLLTDYQVVVIGVTQAELRQWAEEARLVRTRDGLLTDARTLAAQVGLAKAMRKHDLEKIITFHSSVAKARRFTDPAARDSLVGVIGRMSRSSKPTGELWSAHISGGTPAGRRKTLLDNLKSLPSGSRGILSNCACLGEGVDVPALDGIAFIDPKRSMVDIIQAVGRVIRKAADKRIGTVVIPVFVDESEDADHALSNSAFDLVWQVLRALRAHDTQLADELDELRVKLGKRSLYGGKVRLPDKIKIDVPTLILNKFEQAFYVRTVERTACKPPLTEQQILAWADEHRARTGEWPRVNSGAVHQASGETWRGVHMALYNGGRGLRGSSSLANLFAENRGVRNPQNLPTLVVDQVLEWADEHHKRTGRWPRVKSGPVHAAPGETWIAINDSLIRGARGFPGGSSLAKVLAEQRGVRNEKALPPLTIKKILVWADAHYERTGDWPTRGSGSVHSAHGETWSAVNGALCHGARGLTRGSSLAKLLAEYRNVRNEKDLPPLTVKPILAWADEYHQRTGNWPSRNSGPVHGAPGESWTAIHAALANGRRSLRGGSSLAKLLAKYRGVRNKKGLPALTVHLILEWADKHHKRTGNWPTENSGPVHGVPGETWNVISAALQRSMRGLPGGSSLAKLLLEYRGKRNHLALPALTIKQILAWADAQHKRTGHWPKVNSGPVHDSTGENWNAISAALRVGCRGLSGGSSLAKLLAEHRAVRNKADPPRLTIEEILAWANAHHQHTGEWPTANSGSMQEAPAEDWANINSALRSGLRGLSRDSSLAKLLAKQRDKPPVCLQRTTRHG